MNVITHTVFLGETGFSFWEHLDKVAFNLRYLPSSLVMLGFLALGLWWAWRNFEDCFERFHAAREENRNLIAELDDVVAGQNELLADLNFDYTKTLGQLERREDSIKDLHCKLSDYEVSAEQVRIQLEAKDKALAKVSANLSAAENQDRKSTELESALKEKSSEIDELRGTLTVKDDLEVKVTELEKQLQTKAEEFDALKEINLHLKRENSEFKDEFKEASSALAESGGDTSIKGFFSSMNALSAKVPDLEDGLNERDNEIAVLKSQLDELDALKSENELYKTTMDEVQATLGVSAGEKAFSVKDVAESVAAKDGEISSLREENDRLKSKGGDASSLQGDSDSGDTNQSLDAKDREIEYLKRELESATGESLETAQDSSRYLAAAAIPLAAFTSKGEASKDESMGIIYQSKPGETDDLWEIRGIDDKLESKLNDQGIYQFKQIALWDEKQIEAVESKLGSSGKIRKEQWVHQASDLHFERNGERIIPQVSLYQKAEGSSGADSAGSGEGVDKLKADLDKKDAELDELKTKLASLGDVSPNQMASSWGQDEVTSDPSLGIVYKSRPDEVDDLTQISGVANVLEGKLHNEGVYRYKQIATWNEEQISTFGERLSFKDRIDRDQWVHQAIDLHYMKYGEHLSPRVLLYHKAEMLNAEKPEETMQKFAGEDVKADEKFGVVYTSKPDKVDDLKKIKGVGKVLEEKLNEFGVYRFKQVALWTPPVVIEFVENLPFGDRVTRDNWIEQAKELHQTKYGSSVEA